MENESFSDASIVAKRFKIQGFRQVIYFIIIKKKLKITKSSSKGETMSGRRRRSETSWDNKEEKIYPSESHLDVSRDSSPKWSNSEINEGNLSGRQSWDNLQENRNNRERHRMQTYPTFNEREEQYSSGLPYRTRDRQVGGIARVSRDQAMSPNRSRSRSKGRVRGVSRSRSRSRGRDWKDRRTRSRSPYYDDNRYESNAYANVRNTSRLSSRRPDYMGGSSRYNDYQRNDRNIYDDQNHKHQLNRKSKVLCKFFAAGNCYNEDCKFSHDQHPRDNLNPSDLTKSNFGEKEKKKPWNGPLWDVVEPRGGFSERSRGGSYVHTSDENNRTSWDFHDVRKPKSNHPNLDSKKGSWDDVESRGFNESPRDENHAHTSDENHRTSWDFPDVGKPKSNHSNLDNKKVSWNAPSWDDVESRGFNESSRDENHAHTSDENNRTSWDFPDLGKPKSNHPNLDNKKRSWNGPSLDDVELGGFNGSSRDGSYTHTSDDNNSTSWDFPSVGKPKSNPDFDTKKGSLNGSSCANLEPQGGFNVRSYDESHGHRLDDNKTLNVGKLKSNPDLDNKKGSWNGFSWADFEPQGDFNVKSRDESHGHMLDDNRILDVRKPNCNLDDNRRWNGPSLGEVSASGFSNVSKPVMSEKSIDNIDRKAKKWNGLLWDEVSEPGYSDVEKKDYHLPDVPVVSSDVAIVVNNFDLNKDNLVTDDGHQEVVTSVKDDPIQASIHDMNSQSLPYLDGPKIMINSQVQDPRVIDDPQVNGLPLSLPEILGKGQLPQLSTELILRDAIDYLKSLPKSANNQDTSPTKEQPNSAANVEVKIGVKNLEGTEGVKQEQDNIKPEGKIDEGDVSNDEKAMRQFKAALVEFVKEILKPKWKEGKLSREVHKAVVKKVVDKVSSTIQGNQIPKTHSKIEQYLACSKPKISKLVEAYVERLLKA